MQDILISYWLILAVSLIITGLFAGTLAGLLGVGGGIVIVPVLFQIFTALDVDITHKMHLAVGTSLATIIPTSIRSLRAHHKKGAVDLGLLKAWALPLLVGVLLGTYFATRVPSGVLTLIFAVIALIVALHMTFGKSTKHLSDHLPTGVLGAIIPAIIGGISAMMGIGGGTLGVPILTLFNYPIHKAVGTATGFGLIISIPAATGFLIGGMGISGIPSEIWAVGYISLLGFVLIVPCTVLAVPFGVKIAHKLSQPMLRRAFAIFLGITSIRMFMDVFSG